MPGIKPFAVVQLHSDTWAIGVKRIRGKKQPLTAAGVYPLRDDHPRSIKPTRALAAEILTLECTLSDLVNQAYDLIPAEVELEWRTAPPRMPIRPRLEPSYL
jgi:hypothetical protein